MQIATSLQKMNAEHRNKYNITTLEKQVAEHKKGCLSMLILMVGITVFSIGIFVILLGTASEYKESFIQFILVALVFFIIGIAIIMAGVRATKSKKIKDVDIHKVFKKLKKRYNDLENNLKEINAQLIDEENTYIVKPYLYLSSDWFITFDDCIKTKDIINVFIDYYEERNPTTKLRTRYDRINFLLNSGEFYNKFLDKDLAIQVIDILKQKNPNIFTSEKITCEDGRKLTTDKHKHEIIAEYNRIVAGK